MSPFPPRRILVPVDFSEPSLSAVGAAALLAQRLGSRLELLHVEDMPRVPFAGMTRATLSRHWRDYHRWVRRRLLETAAGLPRELTRVLSAEGPLPEALLRRARRSGCGLIVMGTHAATGLRRALAGSLTETVVGNCPVPVLALHRRERALGLEKILVPVIAARYSDQAFLAALGWARVLGAEVTAVHAAPDEEAARRAPAALKRRLERLAGIRPEEVKLLVRIGPAEREIIEEAVEGKFDLIALAAHRKPLWKDWTLGTTARLLRHSPVPVLAFPTTGASRYGGLGAARALFAQAR